MTHARSAYFIGTRAPSRPPELSCRPSGQCPGRPTSSGLGLLHQDSAYFVGTQDVPVQAGPGFRSTVGDGPPGPAPSLASLGKKRSEIFKSI